MTSSLYGRVDGAEDGRLRLIRDVSDLDGRDDLEIAQALRLCCLRAGRQDHAIVLPPLVDARAATVVVDREVE